MKAHGERHYRAGCRCNECRAWRDHANAICRARRAAGKDKTHNPSHGTERKYVAGCRCEPCTAAGERRNSRQRTHATARYKTISPGQRRANAASWRATHRDHINAYHRRWIAANKAWRDSHRDAARDYARTWRAANPGKVKAYAAKWRAEHRQPQCSPLWPFLPAATSRDQLIETISAAVPHVPQAIRADVCQDLAVTWLTTGTITRADVRAAVTANWRLIPTVTGREISLSNPAYRSGDGIETLADRLSA
jgi:hypothetical protein